MRVLAFCAADASLRVSGVRFSWYTRHLAMPGVGVNGSVLRVVAGCFAPHLAPLRGFPRGALHSGVFRELPTGNLSCGAQRNAWVLIGARSAACACVAVPYSGPAAPTTIAPGLAFFV